MTMFECSFNGLFSCGAVKQENTWSDLESRQDLARRT